MRKMFIHSNHGNYEKAKKTCLSQLFNCKIFLLPFFTLIFFAALLQPVKADDYILHKPTEKQLSEKEALKIASAFAHDVLNFSFDDLTPYYDNEHLFGPGNQWDADTEEDCWIICVSFNSIKTEYEYVKHLCIIVNGTSGEVERWQYRDLNKQVTYDNVLPSMSRFSADDAYQMAIEDLKKEHGYDIKKEKMYYQSCLYNDLGSLLWETILFFNESGVDRVYHIRFNAESGEITYRELE